MEHGGSADLGTVTPRAASPGFPTTQWTALAEASLQGDARSRQALAGICQRYWTPVFRYVQGRTPSAAEAQDLTQDFFVHVLEKDLFARADRERGRFRSFLLGALQRFLHDQRDRRQAQRRGGGLPHVSWEAAETAAEDGTVAAGGTLAFDREWACAILEHALERLRAEYRAGGEPETFAVVKAFLPGAAESPSYEEAAARLALSPAAFKSAVHRLRLRLRALVREEIARTVSAPHEIEAELLHLHAVLRDRTTRLD